MLFFLFKKTITCYSVYMPLTTSYPKEVILHNFVFRNKMILVKNISTNELPNYDDIQNFISNQMINTWFTEMEYGYCSFFYEDSVIPKGFFWIPIRSLFANNFELSSKICRAYALLEWRMKHRYCCQCGGPLIDDKFETARTCVLCNESIYPTISPAMIVLIQKGDSILLAKHHQRNTDLYTCLAGFVEPGETIEECVAREIREEVGIEVTNIKYHESQSWPFPDQLMLAFTADYKSGSLFINPNEIEDAQWFSRDKLPIIPKPGSLAYTLIMGKY